MNDATGYRGKIGKESPAEFFKQDDWYEQLFIQNGDPRTTDKLFLRTPEPALLIVASYLLFLAFGPKLMRHRQPFDLRWIITTYNFALVILSAYMSYEFFMTSTLLGYSYSCQGIDWNYSTDAISMRLVNAHWLFFFSKIIELSDTVFFVLRKKNNQLTFLHVYHHSTMVLCWWLAVKYVPVGQTFFAAMINSFIHFLLYIYYGLSSVGPQMQKYLWWKKYLTTFQLVQFVAVITHTGYNKFVRTDCDYPDLYNSMTLGYTFIMFFLFSYFYHLTYRIKRSYNNIAKTNRDVSELAETTENGRTEISRDVERSLDENENLGNGYRRRLLGTTGYSRKQLGLVCNGKTENGRP